MKRRLVIICLIVAFLLSVMPVPDALSLVLGIVFMFTDIYMIFVKRYKINNLYTKWLVVFVFFCFLSVLWTISVRFSVFVILIRMFPLYAFTFFITLYVKSYKDLNVVLFSFYFASIIYMVWIFSYIDISILGEGRFDSAFEDDDIREKMNSNYIAGQFVFAIYSGYYLFGGIAKRARFLKRFLYLVATLPMLYVIFVSGSRTSLGVLIIPLLVMSLSGKSMLRGLLFGSALIVVLFVLITKVPGIYDILGVRILDAFNVMSGNEQGTEDTSRLILAMYGLEWFQDNPIFGIGINCFRVLSNQSGWYAGKNFYAHNNYIELLVDIGLMGLFLYYRFAHWNIWKSYKRMKNGKSRRVILSFLIVLLFSDIFWVAYYNPLSQLMLCLAFVIIGLEENKIKLMNFKQVDIIRPSSIHPINEPIGGN